jgi:hypothetical protein
MDCVLVTAVSFELANLTALVESSKLAGCELLEKPDLSLTWLVAPRSGGMLRYTGDGQWVGHGQSSRLIVETFVWLGRLGGLAGCWRGVSLDDKVVARTVAPDENLTAHGQDLQPCGGM